MASGKVSIALFKSKNIPLCLALGFQNSNLLADELKPGQCAPQLHSVLLSHRGGHIRGNNGRYSHRILRHGPLLVSAAADIVQQQHTHLIAGHQLILSACGNRNSHPVAVRVRSQQKVRLHRFAQGQAPLHCLPNFRVRIRAGWEIAVGLFLLRHHGHIRDSDFLQNSGHTLQACTVQRRIHQLQRLNVLALFVGMLQGLRFDGLDEAVQRILSDHTDQAGRLAVLKRHSPNPFKNIHRFDAVLHRGGHLQGYLAAILAVHFVTVVFGRIVAGGDANARPAAQISRSKAQRRSRLKAGIHPGNNFIGRQHTGRLMGKKFASNAAVIRNGNPFGQRGGIQIIRQALCGLAHGVNVHPVITGPKHSAQAAGTKLQIPIKAVALLLVLHGTQRCFCVFVHLRAFQPALQLLLAILRHLCLNASFVVLFRF